MTLCRTMAIVLCLSGSLCLVPALPVEASEGLHYSDASDVSEFLRGKSDRINGYDPFPSLKTDGPSSISHSGPAAEGAFMVTAPTVHSYGNMLPLAATFLLVAVFTILMTRNMAKIYFRS